ncbi:MAG TPA: hypothetical protein VK604_16895 [Bryobacteraceae bacterium]|nr:hypothetical protein [Bryobacteraceae bacterium]
MQPAAAASAQPGRSTGPRTPEGKEISSKNSTKHGCCSKRLLLPGEDPRQWEALKAGWLKEYGSSSPVSSLLISQAAEKQWLLVRAQNRFLEIQQFIYDAEPECRLWNEEQCKLYEKFQRYLTTAERAFQRAFQDIERLRRTHLKQHDVAFREDLELRRFALRERKNRFEIALLHAKTELCETKSAAQKPPPSPPNPYAAAVAVHPL